jgi:hypothetical protein
MTTRVSLLPGFILLAACAAFAGCQKSQLRQFGFGGERAKPGEMSPLERDVLMHRVSVGMDKAQVFRSVGKACDTATQKTADGETETWVYCAVCPDTQGWVQQFTTGRDASKVTCSDQRIVKFVGGKVTEVRE